MTDTPFAEGGCACGAVRYALLSAPMFTHCRDCQRQTGSAFVLNALLETDRIDLRHGELVRFSMPTSSGHPHDIYRCAACGTALWSDYGARAGLRFVRVGTLDEPERVPPDLHIFTRSKLPWIGLPSETPAFEIYYDARRLWSAAARERLREATRPPEDGRSQAQR